MTPFTKHWVTSTCAPESIQVIRKSNIGALLSIRNESGSKHIYLLEDTRTNTIVGIGKDYNDIRKPVSYAYSKAADIIAEMLGLISVTL